MPIYEYECEQCNTTFEVMHAISAKPLKKCQNDGCQGKVRRLVSSTGFILKGEGWYTSDYPSEARKKGWEQESKQANSGSSEAPAKDGKSPAPANAEGSAPKPKPAATTPAQKSPYAGGSRKKVKPSK